MRTRFQRVRQRLPDAKSTVDKGGMTKADTSTARKNLSWTCFHRNRGLRFDEFLKNGGRINVGFRQPTVVLQKELREFALL